MTDRPDDARDPNDPTTPERVPSDGTAVDSTAEPIDDEIVEAEVESGALADLSADDGSEDFEDEEDEDDLDRPGSATAGAPVPAAGRPRGGPLPTQRAPSASELAVRIRDQASRVFVIATAAVFIAILLNGMILGKGGLLTKTPTPSTSPSESVSASASAGASSSPSLAPSSSVTPSSSVAPSPSLAPSPSASPAPS